MSNNAPEMGQGERSLTRAAAMVAEARKDFDGFSTRLDGQIAGLEGRWTGAGGRAFLSLHRAWTQKQHTITNALNEFEASLVATERDNTSTDEAQSANYHRTAGRLG